MHSLSVIVFMSILSLVLAGIMLFCGAKFSPKSESELKNSVYECGMPVFCENKVIFNSKSFIFALLFIIYDAEVMFLFPLALAFDELKIFVVLEGFIFLSLLLLSLYYAVQKNMLRFR